MKILMVTGIFPPDIGGPASYVPRMAEALSRRGHGVEVVTLADDPAMRQLAAYGFPVHRIARSSARPLRMARTVAMIARLARDAEVVFANGLYIESIVAAGLASRPTVAKVVGDTIWERARHAGRNETIDEFQAAKLPAKWRLLRKLQDVYIRRYDRVITPSAYLKRIATGWGASPACVDVVYNAVPLGPNGTAPRQEHDVVSVGRLVPWKGFADLIDVAGRRGWSLRIVGDGPLRAELEARARAAGAAVTFDGHLPQGEVAGAIRSGRVFVLNSSYEGLPHIVLEAMAAGVPVIATSAGGTPETIADGETGVLLPVGDSQRLEAALERLLGDAEMRQAMARRAISALGERFSFARMVEQTEAVLARAAASREAER